MYTITKDRCNTYIIVSHHSYTRHIVAYKRKAQAAEALVKLNEGLTRYVPVSLIGNV